MHVHRPGTMTLEIDYEVEMKQCIGTEEEFYDDKKMR